MTPAIVARQNLPVILYLDPPFDIRDGFADVYEKCVNLALNLPKDKIYLIAFEHASHLNLPENIGAFSLLKSKKFGNTSLSYYS